VDRYLRDRLVDVGWTNADLLIATLGLSGYMLGGDINGILAGRRPPTRGEYNVIAAALNERYADLGGDHPVPPWEDLRRTLANPRARPA
jgi:hypothetical protein